MLWAGAVTEVGSKCQHGSKQPQRSDARRLRELLREIQELGMSFLVDRGPEMKPVRQSLPHRKWGKLAYGIRGRQISAKYLRRILFGLHFWLCTLWFIMRKRIRVTGMWTCLYDGGKDRHLISTFAWPLVCVYTPVNRLWFFSLLKCVICYTDMCRMLPDEGGSRFMWWGRQCVKKW